MANLTPKPLLFDSLLTLSGYPYRLYSYYTILALGAAFFRASIPFFIPCGEA